MFQIVEESQEPQVYYFRCTTNPNAPILVLESYWEAKEMEGHPDYERVDAKGEIIVSEEDQAPHPIPFNVSR